MKNHIHKIFTVLFVLSLLIVTHTNAATITETFEKTLSFSHGSLLSLSNENGDVEITSWSKNEIEIIAFKKVRASNDELAGKMMERLQILIREHNGELEIETEHPRGSSGNTGFFDWVFGNKNGSYSVHYKIRIPEKADLNINTTNGNVEIEKINGRLRLESTNGKILAEDINGMVRCKTTNGSIKIDFDDIPKEDEMHFRTTNGSIRLYLPDDFSGYVDLKTTNGSINSDFDVNRKNYKSRTHLRGEIDSGESEVTCSTTNGSIYLYANE